MKYIFSLVLLMLIFCRCSDHMEKTFTVTAFEETGELTASVQKIPVPILIPRFMCIVNDKLFIYKEKEGKLFDIFNLPDCAFLCSDGIRGQGPNDFNLLDTRSFHVVGNTFKVLESGRNILKTVVFEDNHLSVLYSEQVFENHASNNGFYPLADSIYLTFGNIGDLNEYGLYDKKKGTTTKTGNYPKWTTINTKEPYQLFVTYLKTCVVRPDGKRFASFYGRFKRMRLYDNSATLLHDIDVRIEPYSKDIEEDVKNQAVYYIGQPQVSGNYIYALCSNFQGNNPEAPNTCELHVWNWDGEPVACYKFDRKISLIALSEKYGKIFALDRSIDDELYIYDIPKLKK
ncbi:hypothetical protein FACS189474_3260 [Bacteroidia bacterium]|nr:hypothetical protein FACS189440_15150 [Bacteroidia bacterium]GHT88291.1 hypothetical protein FACS189474_3260 [Bacteroidia bacterium]